MAFDGASSSAKVCGVAGDQQMKARAILAAGNVEGVAAVDDKMAVSRAAPAARF